MDTIYFLVARYPGINFSVHCGPVKINKAKPGWYKCDPLTDAIKTCQALGVKIVIGLRSEAGSKWLQKKGDGKEFAQNIWKFFLGGKHKERPFGE